jgi:hypothetical protein
VVIDLAADAQVSRDLAAGGVFVPGCALRLAEECDLLVCGANHRLVLPARVVYVDAVRGAGLELVGFSTEMKAQIAELEPICAPAGLDDEPVLEEATEDAIDDAIEDAALAAAFPDDDDDDDDRRGYTEPVPLVVLEALDDDLTVPVFSDRAGDRHTPARDDGDHPREGADTDAYPQLRDGTVESHGDGDHDSGALDTDAYPQLADTPDDEIARIGDASLPTEAYPALPGDAAGELYEIAAGPDSALRAAHDADKPFPRNVHERLRGLTLVAQHKLAVSGELHERIVLERLYGKNVWETLLRNPRLTAPEVSRIARYGSLPRVLLEIIVGNNVWLQVPEVRRALLSNPRLGTDQIMKVLRLTPKHELKLAAIQTAYPIAVRHAAKLLLRGD